MTKRTQINKIHIVKMLPIFKKEFSLDINSSEVLIIGGNGAGKTSFLRLIKALSSFDYSDLFNKSCSQNAERDIDINYEVQLPNQKLKVSFQETYLKSSKEVLSKKLILNSMDSSSKELIRHRRTINIQTIETNFNIGLIVDDKFCSFYLNDEFLNKSELNEIEILSGNLTIADMLLHCWTESKKNKPSAEISLDTDELFNNLVELLMFFTDQHNDLAPQIFAEDISYFEDILLNSFLTHRKLKNSKGWFFTRGSWFIDSSTNPIDNTNWLTAKLNHCIENDIPFLSIQGSELAILKRIANDIGVKDIKLNVLLNDKQKNDDGTVNSNWKLNGITIVDNKNNEFDSKNLSYGQKRYFSLHMYLYRNSTTHPFLIDEPTNGLHHGFIKKFYYDTNKQSQSFMTTQSPWLLNYVEVDSAEDALNKFVICKKIDNCFSWRNLNKTEIKTILKSKENGIQSMDEILISRGIW